MDFKSFFKNKLNIAFVVLLGVSAILLIVANYVTTLMGISVILFGVTCGFAVPVVLLFKNRNNRAKAIENIELSQSQAKSYARQETMNKWNYIIIIGLFGIFAVILVYSGLMMYVR